ncbi:hypothetical protein DEO72_LG3g2487 [Vigna unguiculata]|uniref:Uncharacterized protein n=1 Tax=Vigna unguiculata TaxID=3917 RepID=A0A4D6LH84_VIGUN|nr:hypothetical protein DEO72_LG3g2487 [Vigna unguiculata]
MGVATSFHPKGVSMRSLTNKYSEMGWAVVVVEAVVLAAVAVLVAGEEVDLEVEQVVVEVLELEEV